DKLVVSLRGGLATIDLTNLGTGPCKIERIVEGGGRSAIVGKKTRQVFYIKGGGFSKGGSLYATHLDTKVTREIVKLPEGLSGACGLAINADETLIASSGNDPKARELAKARGEEPRPLPPKVTQSKLGKGMANRSMVLFTVNVQTGEIKRIHYATSW